MDRDLPGFALHAEQIGEERRGQVEHGAHQQAHHRDERQAAVGRAVGFLDVARAPVPRHQRRGTDSHQPKEHSPSQSTYVASPTALVAAALIWPESTCHRKPTKNVSSCSSRAGSARANSVH